jgi:LPXTG-motif cell wall-anchored protein
MTTIKDKSSRRNSNAFQIWKTHHASRPVCCFNICSFPCLCRKGKIDCKIVKGHWAEGQIYSAIKGGPGFVTQTVTGPACKMVQTEEEKTTDHKNHTNTHSNTHTNTHINIHNKTIIFLSPQTSVKWSSTNLIIHVKIKESANIMGKWHFNLGGKMYVTEGGGEVTYTVKDAPVGTYNLSAKFVSNDEKQVIESQSTVVTVATETGGTLPKTATPWYNFLVLGTFLSLLGLALFLRASRNHE